LIDKGIQVAKSEPVSKLRFLFPLFLHGRNDNSNGTVNIFSLRQSTGGEADGTKYAILGLAHCLQHRRYRRPAGMARSPGGSSYLSA